MSKSYEDGMTKGSEGLHARSKWVLENTSPEAFTSVTSVNFPKVSLSEVCPANETEIISDGAIKENRKDYRDNA